MLDSMHDNLMDDRPGYRWDDYRPEDRVRANLSIYRRRVERSREVVRKWLLDCKRPYIAFSGGKDSLCILSLVQSEAVATGRGLLPVMWHDSGVEWPGVPLVIDRLKGMGLIDHLVIVRPEISVPELKRKQVAGLITAEEKDHLALFDPIERAIRQQGFDGAAIGLRKQESRARLMNAISRGHTYRDKSGVLKCQPIQNWEWQDVFAHIAQHRLPLHPIYSAPLHQLENRGRIRLSWWLSTDYWRHGEMRWVRLNYPQVFSEIIKLIPEAAVYA